MKNVRPFYVLCPRCPKLHGPMHGNYVQFFRCECETGEEVVLPDNYEFEGLPVIVGYEGHRDSQSLLQKLTADRLKRLNPYAGNCTDYDEANPVTLASIRRVTTAGSGRRAA